MTRTIAIQLPNATTYVTGKVNDTDYVFTLSDSTGTATIWETDVERSENDVYHCVVTAIDSTGNSSTVDITLYYGLELITDRTSNDVSYVKELIAKGDGMSTEELSQWLAGLKGYYCFTDLNRVENAVYFVNNRLIDIGIDDLPISIKNTWVIADIPTKAEMFRYLNNVKSIRGAISLPETAPELPSNMERLNYEAANNIEMVLLCVDAQIAKIRQNFIYSNEIYSGEV